MANLETSSENRARNPLSTLVLNHREAAGYILAARPKAITNRRRVGILSVSGRAGEPNQVAATLDARPASLMSAAKQFRGRYLLQFDRHRLLTSRLVARAPSARDPVVAADQAVRYQKVGRGNSHQVRPRSS